MQEMDLMPSRLTLDQINKMEEALHREVGGRLTSQNLPRATSAVVRAYFNAQGEGPRPYMSALSDIVHVNRIAAEVLSGWGLMPFIPATRESVVIPSVDRAAVAAEVLNRLTKNHPVIPAALEKAIREGNENEILRIMAEVSHDVLVPAYAKFLGYSLAGTFTIAARTESGEGLSEVEMPTPSSGGKFQIRLDMKNAGAADLLARLNHELAEVSIYAGMSELSTLKGNDRGDLEALALALSRRVAESAGLRSLADMGHAVFLADARERDIKRVDAERVAEGFIDSVVREKPRGQIPTEAFRTAFNSAGQGIPLLEITGDKVFPMIFVVDARSFLNDQGNVDESVVTSVKTSVLSQSERSTYLWVVDNLEDSARAQRAQLGNLLADETNVIMSQEGVGLRGGKVYSEALRSAMPSLFKWDKSLVPLVRLGAMSTDKGIWGDLVPSLLKADVAATILDALKHSRVVDLSA